MLEFYNTFRKEAISLEEFIEKNECKVEKNHPELIALLKEKI